jgi:hypothetical protein
MNRTGWITAIALVLAPAAAFAQMGGMGGMGAMGGGMGGGMGMGMGGMGGMSMGGMMGGSYEVRRAVQVEMEGGQHLNGQIDIGAVIVLGDLGRYGIMPEKLKAIRFLKPEPGARPAAEEPDEAEVGPGANGGRGLNGNPQNAMNPPRPRAKVITTSGQEILGSIINPGMFRLEMDFGVLVPRTDKLRVITFTDGEPKSGAGKADAAAPGEAGGGHGASSSQPRYFRHGDALVVSSRSGERVTLYDLKTRRSLELAGPEDGPIGLTPFYGPDLLALGVSGPKVNRIAAADTATGWHVQELRRPVAGRVTPTVFQGFALYTEGRYAYAYSAQAHRWDVAELPEGLRATPVIGLNGATIEGRGHIYAFTPGTGRWEHVDVRAVLDVAGAGARK